jgi:FKBP-type peptidyl-prolyl cis-trans isomerase 2
MISKKDFVEIEFTGKVKGGDIFDTNISEDAKKVDIKIDEKPLVVCVGQGMVIPGFDKSLEGKEINKLYSIEIAPEEAFGPRKRDLIQLIPLKVFREKNVNPVPGMTLALDNNLVKVVSVSGGRVLVDFNNPLAGKNLIYDFKIKRKVDDKKEQVNSIVNTFLKDYNFNFEIVDKTVIFKIEQVFEPLIKEINKKFKDILELEFKIDSKK